MKDEIFWGNLKGLLKTGKWNLSLEEASALLLIFKEVEIRSQPLIKKEDIGIKKGTKNK